MFDGRNREEWVGTRPVLPTREFGRMDLYVAAFLAGVGVVLAVVIVAVLWPWKELVGIGITLIGLSVGGLQVVKSWQHHQIDIEAKRNRAMIVHEGPGGFGYVHQGQVQTHNLASTPYAPTVPMMGAGWNTDDIPGIEGPDQQEEPDYPQDFNELLRNGFLAPGSDFVVGFEDGKPVKMDKLTALGVAGMPGFGKTVFTLVMMMEGVVKYNGKIKFLVVDPHMYADGDESLVSKVAPLSPFFLTLEDVRETVDDDDQEYLDILDQVEGISNPTPGDAELAGWMMVAHMEMQRRLEGKKGETWVFVMDEFVAIMDNSTTGKPVASMLKKIQQQARKLGMFSLLISQDWKAASTGGSDIRQSIPTFAVLNTAESIAELVLPAKYAATAPTLDIGEALVKIRGKTHQVRVPMATLDDAETLAELYGPRKYYTRVREIQDEPMRLPAGGDQG